MSTGTKRRLSPAAIGTIFVAVVLVLFVVLFSKDRIGTMLRGGETISVHFPADFKLRPDISEVKTAYVEVGVVSGLEREDDGTATVTIKVDDDVVENLGSAPTATVRATTLLGGIYFVDLQPGGDPGRFEADEIPLERASGPTELGDVVQALQPDALGGLQHTVGHLDGALNEQGTAALRRLTASAPAAMEPAARVLDAATGAAPADLTHVVDGLENTARVLDDDGRLAGIVEDLGTTTGVLGARAVDVATTLDGLPDTLRTGRAGLERLDGTLATLRDTAGDLRPVARQLDDTLGELDPVLNKALPLVHDTRALLGDARPLVEQLVPDAAGATDVLADLRGPVLDRVNGPINDLLQTPYAGSGPYAATRSDRPLYWDVVYALVGLGRASPYEDENGGTIGFQPGVGPGSVSGVPIPPDQVVQTLLGGTDTNPPVDTLPPADRAPVGTGLLGGN